MLKVYSFDLSGNSYKVRLMLSLLGLPHEVIPVNLKVGEHKLPDFLELNPLGQVPILIDDEVRLRDSQAILVYLGRRYGGETWLPNQPEAMARVMQWLSFAANEIANSLTAARSYFLMNKKTDVELAQQKAHQILQVMDEHLHGRQWLEGARPTIADIACYPYVGLAPQAQVSLSAYPQIQKWLEQFKMLPDYICMPGL